MQFLSEALDAVNRNSIRRRLWQITSAEYDRMTPAEQDFYNRELFRAWERNYEIQEGFAPRSAVEQSVEDYEDWTKPDLSARGV